MRPTAPTRWRAIKSRLKGYTAGDTDLAWSRITYWRALLAAALDQAPHEPITSALVSGLKTEPALDILAGWLASRIDGPVQRAVGDLKVELVRTSETMTLSRPQTGVTATLTRTGRPEALIPLARREAKECLAEDLRRLDADEIYSRGAAGHRQGAVRVSPIVEKYSDTAALVAAAGDRLVDAITDAIAERGRAQIVLTGGGTGIGLLKQVGEHGDEIDWSKVHLFWGDDRFVPEDDDERNEKQAREALLDHIDIPAANVHRDVRQRRRVRRRPRRRGAGLRARAGRQRRRRPARAGLRRAPARHGRRGPHQLAVSRDTRRCARPTGWWSACRTPPSRRRGESR